MATLQILLPDGEQTHDLTEDFYTIGRVTDNMIQIDDGSVSSRHAQLTLAEGKYELVDLGSTNGTRVDGSPVTRTTITDGARIRFGQIEAIFKSRVAGGGNLQPLPEAESIGAEVAESTSRPSDFKNASPYGRRGSKKDSFGAIALAIAAIAILAGLAAIGLVFTIQSPV